MLINEALIELDLKAGTKEDAIKELADIALKEGRINDIKQYTDCVFKRENEYTTGVGNNIAIPHGKSIAVLEPTIIFGKSASGIDWNSLDDEPVNIIFLLAVPKESVGNLHLKILSMLSRKLMNEDFVTVLKNSNSKLEILEIINSIQKKLEE